MRFQFLIDLEQHLLATYGAEVTIQPEVCPSNMTGDITVNCFRFAKLLKGNPMQKAAEICDWLKAHADVTDAESIKAFVNVTIKPEALFSSTIGSIDAIMDSCLVADPKHKLIEFSAPNTNKPQHLGHVRNNVLGQSTVSLLRRVGNKVTAVNLINDRGIHICKSMLAYQYFGEGATPESSNKKGDHLVGYYYVRYNKALTEALAEYRQAHPEAQEISDNDLFLKTKIGQETQEMLQKWEEGDAEVHALWAKMNGWVFKGFDETYARLGVNFDQIYLESNTYKSGRDIILQGLESGAFYKREDGAIEIDLEDVKCGKKVVLRSDGTSVYITQDIGTTVMKADDFTPDGQIWVVGDEQKYHFKVLFEILKRLGYSWADDLHHMAYGMVNLPNGRMKSREGTVVDADDLLDEMERLAVAGTLERCGANQPDNLEERGRVIGIGALKFMLLKVNPTSSIKFDPDASMKFEGDTGPYVQYAYARIRSILRKAGDKYCAIQPDWNLLGEEAERNLALTAVRYGDVVQSAAKSMDSSQLAGYLLDLAKAFSRFYNSCPVLTAETPELIATRLYLSEIAATILQDGLNTLTIDTLEEM